MSYELDVFGGVAFDAPDLARRVEPRVGVTVRVERDRFVVDGAGFELQSGARAVRFVAPPARGQADERAMEWAASILAGDAHEVIDRHTGHRWTGAVLTEWLAVTGLLSGRALAVNEERIAHATVPVAAQAFAARVDTIVAHVPSSSAALRARVHEELAHYATRPALVWPAARGLAKLGDLTRLADLSRDDDEQTRAEAFAAAAECRDAAVPLFRAALDDADPNRRRSAVKTLHLVRHPSVLPLVLRALDDRRATVREALLEHGFDEILGLDGAQSMLSSALARRASDVNTVVRRLARRFTR